MKRKKNITEYKHELRFWEFWYLMAIIMLLILLVLLGLSSINNSELERENEILASQLQVYEVKIHCENFNIEDVRMEVDSTAYFSNYTFYKEFMKNYRNKLPSNCEIIE
jgi:hypothetical protein